MDGIYSDRLEYNSSVFFFGGVFFTCEVKNIEDKKNLSTSAENTCSHRRCFCVCSLFKITLSCKPKSAMAGSGILLIPHRLLGYILEQFLSMRRSRLAHSSPLLLRSPLAAAVAGTQFLPENFSHSKGRNKHQNQC